MKHQAWINQGGSVVNFLVVGIVLAVIAVGGVYLVRERAQDSSSGPTASPSPTASTSPQAAQNGQKPSSSPSSTAPSPSAPDQSSTKSDNLPETGPADTFLSIAASAGLFGVVVAYVRSLRYRPLH